MLLTPTLASTVAADSRCPLPEVSVAPSPQQWLTIRDTLAPNESRCLRNTEYYALYGAALMHTGKLSQALEALERALLLNPNNGGAMVDYAEALFLSGEVSAAIRINQQLLARQDLPAPLEALFKERNQRWDHARTRWQPQFSSRVGYHDNLNQAPRDKFLYLTIDGEELALELDGDAQPQPGYYTHHRLSANRYKDFDDGQSRLKLSVQGRRSAEPEVDNAELSLDYEREYQLDDDQAWWWHGTANHVFYGGKSLYSELELGATKIWRRQQCSVYATTSIGSRIFTTRRQMDDQTFTAGGGLSCAQARGKLTLEARSINSRALRDRAGGDRWGGELSATWQRLINPGMLFLHGALEISKDAEGYSPLLERGARRQVQSLRIEAQYLYPLSPTLSLVTGIYHQRQESNIDLFHSSASSFDIGFNLAF